LRLVERCVVGTLTEAEMMKMEGVAGEKCPKPGPGNLPDPPGRTLNRQEEELTILVPTLERTLLVATMELNLLATKVELVTKAVEQWHLLRWCCSNCWPGQNPR